jgi:DNA-directed RNA polymerase subunit RPC12/RpoP/ribosome-associated protein YbcJ (S4-like RNA binding protein)
MEKNEFIIGKEGDIKVDNQYVSRRHAKITRSANGIYIEDLESKNGVFVNGQMIKKKKVTASDRITLGKEYELNLNKILQQLPMSDEEFRDEFLRLKTVYENYTKAKTKIQSESQGKMMLKRSLPMAIPGLLMIGSTTFLGPAATIVGGVLSAGAMVLGTVWGSKDMAKMPERLAELREQFLLDYACPSCKREFGERSWELVKRQGKCPACGREFKLES